MDNDDPPQMKKKPRTSEDFYLFCTYVLDYTNYESLIQEDLRKKSTSPTDSAGLVSDSNLSSGQEDKATDDDSGQFNNYVDSESYDLITCYCKKPFAGRPMIECSSCLTWIHLSCAKIRKKYIPDVFYCVKCTVSLQNEKDVSGSQSFHSSQASSSGAEMADHSNLHKPTNKTSRHFKNITEHQTNSRYREYDVNGTIRQSPSINSPTSPVQKHDSPCFQPYSSSDDQPNRIYRRSRESKVKENGSQVVERWYDGDSAEKQKIGRDNFHFKRFGKK